MVICVILSSIMLISLIEGEGRRQDIDWNVNGPYSETSAVQIQNRLIVLTSIDNNVTKPNHRHQNPNTNPKDYNQQEVANMGIKAGVLKKMPLCPLRIIALSSVDISFVE